MSDPREVHLNRVAGVVTLGTLMTVGAFTVWTVRWLRGYGERWRK